MAHGRNKGKTTKPPMAYKEEQVKSIFNRLDANRDGRLSLYELVNAFKQAGAALPVHLAYQALCRADRDMDGRISQDETLKLLNYILNQGLVIE